MDLFVTATRKKFRFQTERGLMSVEELWDMPLTSRDGFNLDAVAIGLDKAVDTKSFVKKRSDVADVNSQKLEIVKYVIETKLADMEKAEQALANRERKQKLMAALESKASEKLVSMSEEEIRAELAKLG